MRITLHVDQRECIASGLCAAMHPELFRLSSEGLSEPTKTSLTQPDEIKFARDVADCCPAGAVLVTLDDDATG